MADTKLPAIGGTISPERNGQRLPISEDTIQVMPDRAPQDTFEVAEGASADDGDQVLTRSNLRLGAILTALFVGPNICNPHSFTADLK
jgi:hypothetical protein